MNFKALILILVGVSYLWNLFLNIVEFRSDKNPVPDSVKDVYDPETYLKWKAYHREKIRLGLISSSVTLVVDLILLGFNVYAKVAKLFPTDVYSQIWAVTLFGAAVSILVNTPFNYYDTMHIEEKYGFNRSKKTTFFADVIKSAVIELGIVGGLVSAFAAIHISLGDYVAVLFAAILVAFMLVVTFLYPVFSKIFNKFTPLEEGELKDKITALLEKNGYQVKAIKVMDASKRTSKSKA